MSETTHANFHLHNIIPGTI